MSFAIRPVSDRHLRFLTDDFGIWQHTVGNNIDLTRGYALDDSARALVAAAWMGDADLALTYIAYLEEACVRHGRFVLYFSADRQPLEENASEDAIGEAYWALGECVRLGMHAGRARALADAIRPKVASFEWPHGKAYAILGAVTLDQELAVTFANDLVQQFKKMANVAWRWIDLELRYANAIIPYALLETCRVAEDAEFRSVALDMLDFLNLECQVEGVPIAIGNQGWYRFGDTKALYDQQPIDPAYQVLANCSAFTLTGEERFRAAARTYLEWFWGNNLLGRPMVDADDGVFDGLHKDGISPNKGSENVACYLMAQKAFDRLA